MPELPEVEVVRLGLEPLITEALVERVQVLDARSVKRHRGGVEDFVHSLEGQTLAHAVRRGKFLWFPLQGQDRALVCHLGMSGQMLIGDATSDFGPHLRVALDLVGPQGSRARVGFVDQRIFGSLAIEDMVEVADGFPAGKGSDAPAIPVSVSHIARDPLDPHFDEAGFVRALRKKSIGIKRALLDQNLISGVGNIYADEALWAAKLHYDTVASSLSTPKAKALLEALRAVFLSALAQGGTSFDQQYVNVNGQSGYFSRSLEAYGRSGEACRRCGTIMVRERFMNRSSYRCPKCQKSLATR